MEKKNEIIIIEKLHKHDLDFVNVKWCASVRSKDKMRPNIMCVKMDDGLLVATDGNQIHLYTPERNIENGVYEVVNETKSTITHGQQTWTILNMNGYSLKSLTTELCLWM